MRVFRRDLSATDSEAHADVKRFTRSEHDADGGAVTRRAQPESVRVAVALSRQGEPNAERASHHGGNGTAVRSDRHSASNGAAGERAGGNNRACTHRGTANAVDARSSRAAARSGKLNRTS